MFKCVISAVLLMTTAITSPALGQSQASRSIRYVDLDLTGPAGVDILNRRIERTIADMCRARIAQGATGAMTAIERCRTALFAEVRLRRDQVVAQARSNAQVASNASR